MWGLFSNGFRVDSEETQTDEIKSMAKSDADAVQHRQSQYPRYSEATISDVSGL
jgi:hypothetical protein